VTNNPTLAASIQPVWQGSGSSKNSSGFGSSGGVASLMGLKPLWKTFGKTAPPCLS